MEENEEGKDHNWRLVKYYGDGAIYAVCNCGFKYGCWKFNKDGLGVVPAPEKLYYYCPQCGAKKTQYTAEVEKIGYNSEYNKKND